MNKVLAGLSSVAVIGATLVAMVIGKTVGGAAVEGYTESRKKDGLEQAIALAAEQAQGNLPMKLDEQTSLTKVSASGTEILYINELSGVEKGSITREALQTYAADINTRACAAGTRKLLDAGGTMTYVYVDKASSEFGRLTLSKAS